MQSTKSAQTGQSGNIQLPLLLRGDFDVALPAAPPAPPSPPRSNPPAEPPGDPPRRRRSNRALGRALSVEAFDSLSGEHLEAQERVVLADVRDAGERGILADEITAADPKKTPNRVSARLNALEKKGFIYRRGDERKTSSGRNALIWRLVQYAAPNAPTAPADATEGGPAQ